VPGVPWYTTWPVAFCTNFYLKNIFTNVYDVITKFVVIPVTCCGCERAFSKLSTVKSKQRSTISEERLKSLLFLFVEQEMTKSVDFNRVMKSLKF